MQTIAKDEGLRQPPAEASPVGAWSASSASSEHLRREARASGLGYKVSIQAVERRRLQIWGLALLILIAVTGAMVLMSAFPRVSPLGPGLTPTVLRVGLILLALAFSAYALEKELHLRRVSTMLLDEQVRNRALSLQLREHSALLTTGKAVNAILDVEQVLDIILTSAIDLLGGDAGTILQREDGGLRPVCVIGRAAARAELAELAASTREPLLVPDGGGEAAPARSMFVPLVNRDEVLGVLCLDALPQGSFDDHDLRVLTVFAEHAAVAIANARLFESEQHRANDLLEVYRLKSDFVEALTQELRAPLGSILASAMALQGVDLSEAERAGVVDSIERHASRLHRMVEGLVESEGRPADAPAEAPGPVDIAALLQTVAGRFARAGRPIGISVPAACSALGDTDVLERVFASLIDGRFRLGTPPIHVSAELDGRTAVISVIDSGSRGASDGELAIPKAVLAALGGRLWVDALKDGSTAVRVALPAA